MSIIKRARWKDPSGKVTDYDLGANAANVSQDSTHRFVSDTEKNNWNTKLGSTGDGSNLTSKFSQASSRTNLSSGEKDSVSKGKIMKFFADLKAVAFSGSYNDLANKPSIPSGAAASQAVANNCTTTAAGSVLDARQGKVLMDKANQLSSERNIFSRSFNYTELISGSENYSAGYVIIAKVNRVVIANVDVYFKIGLTPGVAHQILSKSQLVDINCWIPTPTGNQSFAFESIAISGVNKNLAIIGLNGSDNAANGLTIYPLDVPTGVGDHIRHQLIWVSE